MRCSSGAALSWLVENMQIQRRSSNCPGTLGTKTSDDNCFAAELEKLTTFEEEKKVNWDNYILPKFSVVQWWWDMCQQVVFLKLVWTFKQAGFSSDLGAHLVAWFSNSCNCPMPMSNVQCLPKIGWNIVLYTGERLLHTSKALLVATSIANLLCSCSLLCALNFDNFLSSCAHLCADVHISVHVKRWSVVGGNKRMGRQWTRNLLQTPRTFAERKSFGTTGAFQWEMWKHTLTCVCFKLKLWLILSIFQFQHRYMGPWAIHTKAWAKGKL